MWITVNEEIKLKNGRQGSVDYKQLYVSIDTNKCP